MHTIDELRGRYSHLTNGQEEHTGGPPESTAATALAVDPAAPPSRTAMRIQLTDLFRRRPELLAVTLTVGEETLGVVHRATVRPDEPDAARATGAPGAQPLAGMPVRGLGRPYVCTQPGCPESKTLLFGGGPPPECDRHRLPMTEQR